MERLFSQAGATLERYVTQHKPELRTRLWLLNIPTSPDDLGDQLAAIELERAATSAQLAALEAETYKPDPAVLADPILAPDAERRWNRQRLDVAAIHGNRLAELTRQQQALARQAQAIAQREAIEAERPDGCFCLGFGGWGVFLVLSGAPVWQYWCSCPDALAMQANAEQARSEYLAAHPHEVDPEKDELTERLARSGIEPGAHLLDLDALDVEPANAKAFAAARAYIERIEAQYARKSFGWADVEGRADVRQTVALYPDIADPWLYLWGDVGRGKTALARALLARWLRGDRPGYFVNVSAWLDSLRRSFERRDDVTPTSALLLPVRTRRLVVLDDFGTESVTGWTLSTVYEVLNYRYDRRLPTILTSNYSPAEAISSLAPDPTQARRMLSRIGELADVQRLAGRNRRERQARLIPEMASGTTSA